MSQRLRTSRITVDEYLEGERDASVRHEYVDGQVYAMAGASDRHNRIAGNLYARINSHLDDNPCEPFISDMKLFVSPSLFYYPDVMVSCDEPATDHYFRTQPVLLVEVMSPTTARTDRHEKLETYLKIPSLREFAIILQDGMEVELHHRTDEGWQTEIYRDPEDQIVFDSISLILTLGDIYRNVRFGFA
jgi:Uma2 family endonuclease